MIEIERGTGVCIETLDERVFYASLDKPEVLKAGVLHHHHPVRSAVYFYYIDPLTSQLQYGLCEISYDKISRVSIVETLPISEQFEIDSLTTFFERHLSNHYPSGIVPDLEFAVQFWHRFHSFISQCREFVAVPYLEKRRVKNTDFTPLGLDFMRQHYRQLKKEALLECSIPRLPKLETLRDATIVNRTRDEDWREDLCRFL